MFRYTKLCTVAFSADQSRKSTSSHDCIVKLMEDSIEDYEGGKLVPLKHWGIKIKRFDAVIPFSR